MIWHLWKKVIPDWIPLCLVLKKKKKTAIGYHDGGGSVKEFNRVPIEREDEDRVSLVEPEDSASTTIGTRKNVVHKITNKSHINLGDHGGD